MNQEHALNVIRHAMCCGKMRHKTMAIAERMVEELRAAGKLQGETEAYYCVFCNFHHIGRKSRSKHVKVRQEKMTLKNLLKYPFDESCRFCADSKKEEL